VDRVLPDPAPVVDVDVVQFELVLLALVSNALDAMPRGGMLTVSVTATGAGVRIEVADTGPGILADRLERIFEPWMTTKPAGQGTGLGLGIARDVVAAHGGTIVARNRDGGGAVFIIELGGSH
jgi:signal transduction histidine kinase